MKLIDLDKKSWQWITLIFLSIIWGSSFILMKKALVVYSPFQIGALRIICAFTVMSPLIFKGLKDVCKKEWLFLFLGSLMSVGFTAFLFPLAQTVITSSLAAMLNSLVPFFALIIGRSFFGAGILRNQMIGVFFGLIGAIGLIYSGGKEISANGSFFYPMLVVLATICYGFNVNIVKWKLSRLNPIIITAFSYFFVAFPSVIYVFFMTDFISTVQTAEGTKALTYIITLGVFGSAIATLVFNYLIKKVSPIFGASVTYLIPVVAIFFGLADEEIISLLQWLCISVILTGVYLVNKR